MDTRQYLLQVLSINAIPVTGINNHVKMRARKFYSNNYYFPIDVNTDKETDPLEKTDN